jgi:hypothetical protein
MHLDTCKSVQHISQVKFDRIEALEDVVRGVRGRLEAAFAEDTALPGTNPSRPSSGHCAAVALIVNAALGGEIASTMHQGESHWFNRVATLRGAVDVDLTGDQFGFAPVRIAPIGGLFPEARVRRAVDVRDETIERAVTLATRAGLSDAAIALTAELSRRAATRRVTA